MKKTVMSQLGFQEFARHYLQSNSLQSPSDPIDGQEHAF